MVSNLQAYVKVILPPPEGPTLAKICFSGILELKLDKICFSQILYWCFVILTWQPPIYSNHYFFSTFLEMIVTIPIQIK